LLQALPYLKLRLTGCQSWNKNKAQQFIHHLLPAYRTNIDYFTAPCQTLALSSEFAQTYQLPLALEVSRNQQIDWQLPGLAYIILKPMLLGSLADCQQLIEQATAYHLQPIIADSFESGLGVSQLIRFAAQYTPTHAPQITHLHLLNSLTKTPIN